MHLADLVDKGGMVAGDAQPDSVEAAAGGDVESFLLVVAAEDAVGGEDGGLDVGEFVAEWVEDDNAEAALGSDSRIDVAVFVDGHSVDSGFVTEVVQDSFGSE